MGVYTIFAFGTGESSTMKKDNIITRFSQACTSPKLVLEGPGLLGLEVKGNVDKGVTEILKQLTALPEGEKLTVNATGFSRGAVTCTRIAYAIQQLADNPHLIPEPYTNDAKMLRNLAQVRFNIMEFDPVAGLTDKSDADARVIAPNVKNYVATLQMDEMRRDFKPQDKSRVLVESAATRVTFLPFYGNHSDGTKVKSKKMAAVPEVSWRMLHQFLATNGTQFQNNEMPALVSSKLVNSKSEIVDPMVDKAKGVESKDLLKLFAHAHAKRGAYLTSGRAIKLVDGLPVFRGQRTFNMQRENYVLGSDFFMNQLEREAMKLAYPKVFNYLFEKGRVDPNDIANTGVKDGAKAEDVVAELAELKADNSALFNRLCKSNRGVTELKDGKITLQEPRGHARTERCHLMQQLDPARVAAKSQAAVDPYEKKLDTLERNLMQVMYQYDREKSDIMAFRTRRQHGLAQDLRGHVRWLAAISPEDVSNKDLYQAALDYVESRYRELAEAESGSALCRGLRAVLEQHGRHLETQPQGILHRGAAFAIKGVARVVAVALECLDVFYTLGKILSGVGSFVHKLGGKLPENSWGRTALTTLGKGIALLGVVVANAIPMAGLGIQDVGRRFDEWASNGWKQVFKPISLPCKLLCYVVGGAVKHQLGLSLLTQHLPNAIKNAGEAMARATGAVTVKVTPVSGTHAVNDSKLTWEQAEERQSLLAETNANMVEAEQVVVAPGKSDVGRAANWGEMPPPGALLAAKGLFAPLSAFDGTEAQTPGSKRDQSPQPPILRA